MKNIEKYQNTKDALEAYNAIGLDNVPFNAWLEHEYEEPRKPTMLEAAESVANSWFDDDKTKVFGMKICDLVNAIVREKCKPVRNCDKYKTAEEAYTAFMKMCCDRPCLGCEFDSSKAHVVVVSAGYTTRLSRRRRNEQHKPRDNRGHRGRDARPIL